MRGSILGALAVQSCSIQDLAYRLLEFLASHALLVDVELVEEGVVQEAAGMVSGASVELLDVVDQVQVLF
ncbi:hypothetical protein [Nostocoides vanveenii]|uniref:hypothetical protein n=1 Tax=Nostocoides vanveenii TaxID=330835 RepID=UPI0031D3567D